jgi:hypothetical protein
MKKASQMNDDDRLALLKLCIESHDENVYGNKKQFWSKMSLLLQQECRVLLKDPQSTIDDMVAARRIVVAQQKTESGTVQQETELLQTLDLWIDIEDEKKRLKDDAKKSAATKEKEAGEAADRRANLFKPRSEKKKRRVQEVDDEGEGGETDSEYEVDGNERHKKRKTATGGSEDTQALVVGLKDFGDGIKKAIVESAEIQSGGGNKAVEDLKAKIEADQKQRDKQREDDLRVREEDKKEAERVKEEEKKEAERVREEDKKEAEKSRSEMREMLAAVLAKLNN